MAYLSRDMTKPTNDCVPSKDSDLSVRMKKPLALSYPLSAQRRLLSDWGHTHFVGFVVLWLICTIIRWHTWIELFC